MREPKEVEISISDKSFNIDLSIEDGLFIAGVLLGLGSYVEKGFPMKVKRSFVRFPNSVETTTKLIKNMQDVAEWESETKALISAGRKRY